jgi:hypothetical protein
MAKNKFYSELFFKKTDKDNIFVTTDRTLGRSFEYLTGMFEFDTDLGNKQEMQLVGVYPDKLIYQQVKGVATLIVQLTEEVAGDIDRDTKGI